MAKNTYQFSTIFPPKYYVVVVFFYQGQILLAQELVSHSNLFHLTLNKKQSLPMEIPGEIMPHGYFLNFKWGHSSEYLLQLSKAILES